MRSKKLMCILLCAALISGGLAACSSDKETSSEEITVVVTDENGETVTDKNGKPVTEVVSTTNPSSTSSTTKSSSTSSTAKNNTTAKQSNTPLREDPSKNQGSSGNNGSDNEYTYFDSSLSENMIVLQKNGKGKTGSKNVVFTVKDNQGICYINAQGDYTVTSTTDDWHGQIVIQVPNTDEVSVRFENVNISTTSPSVIKIFDTSISTDRTFFEEETVSGTAADNVLSKTMKLLSKQQSAPNVSLSFPTGTTSSFETSANSYSGVIYNESKLTIKGNGKLNLKATRNKNNALCSTKSVTFKNVTANLETEAAEATSSMSSSRGIFSYSKVTVESGKLKIRSNGDGIRCDDLYVYGGTVDIVSGACDGVDADDAIVITGGEVTSIALQKSSFKVRRLNNQNDWNEGDDTIDEDDCVTKSTHVFKIDGGTVWGEGKNVSKTCFLSTVHRNNLSGQVSFLLRSAKSENAEETRKYIQFDITGGGIDISTNNKCGKFLYSSPELSKDNTYTVSSPQGVAAKEISPDGDKYIGNSATLKIVSK